MARHYINGETAVRLASRGEEDTQALALAERLGLAYVDLASFRVDPELFRSIPVEWMLRYSFVPEKRTEKSLTIICADPTDVVRLDELELLTGVPLRLKVGSRAAIADILQKSESSQRVLDEATEDFRLQLISEDEEGEETLTIDRITHDASPIIRLVDSIVFNAIQRRASDVHIETQENVVLIKYRIDGVLYQAMDPIDKRHHGTIISRIKVMSELDIAEKRIPQDGRFKLRVRGRTIDFRVSIMPTVHGEDAVIRILDKESANAEFKSLNLEVLGFDAETKKKLRKFIREPYGMVLVTGPTGSGKTTTLYACLSEIQSIEDKIVTIEDPVEYQLRGITQIPVNEKKGLTFARGLRSILRHDPDKIMVGEIRDEETAQIAVQSALTGHLVFTTVHANNVVDVLGRFLNMKVELYNFVSALNCVLAQRLVRRICPECAAPAELTFEERTALAVPEGDELKAWRGAGCDECRGTGYRGRTGIYELLVMDDELRAALDKDASAGHLTRLARDKGMRLLHEDGLRLIRDGTTTAEEVLRVASA
jgi:type IV pilus assembly protein PilB